MQSPDDAHVSSQLPPEQSIVQGAVVHAPWQLPDEQAQLPPAQATLERGVPVPGSGTEGPPFGAPPSTAPTPAVVEEPPQAMIDIQRNEKADQPDVCMCCPP